MALHSLPDPRLHDWVSWTDAVMASNPRAVRVLEVPVGEADSSKNWRDIADALTLMEPTTPSHTFFTDWREWALSLMAVNPN